MQKQSFIVSLSAVGLDSPGLVSQITSQIFERGGNIIDVEENCRRGLFSIFLIIDFADSNYPLTDNMSALEGLEKPTGLKIVVGQYDAETGPYSSDPENHLVTIIGFDKPGIIARVSTFFHQHHINIENCKMIARGNFFSMETVIDTSKMNVPDGLTHDGALAGMKTDLKALCARIGQSVVVQSKNIFSGTKKLIVFDVEAALIQSDSLALFLSRLRGKTRSTDKPLPHMGNQVDQMQHLIENAKKLKGIPIDELAVVSESLQVYPGSLELVRILKSMGFKVALISTGFHFFMKKVFASAGVDFAFSNSLKTDDNGITTGELREPIITSDTKDRILEMILQMEGIDREQVIAVGDGSSNTRFISNVGLSIAFKPEQPSTDTDGVLSNDQIINLLYCLGIPRHELDRYL